jgi:hypothetical protein
MSMGFTVGKLIDVLSIEILSNVVDQQFINDGYPWNGRE